MTLAKINYKALFILLVMVLSIPVGVFLALNRTKFFGRAFGVGANLVIDTGSSFNVEGGVWRNIAQGGEENAWMLAPVVDLIKPITPRYIRIDHVLDYYDVVGKGGDGKLSFNWTKLDLTINDILATGAKPFISLSYMPPAISRSNVTDIPVSWSDWESAVEALVEHVSGRAGLNISGVYYEVWNEPDLFGRFTLSGEKNYLDLYFHSALGAARAGNVQSFKLGGPATTGLYESWFKGLLKFASSSGLKLDFLSWHTYSKDLNRFEDDNMKARVWLTEFPQFSNVELIISETGINSENDKGYDGVYSAIHTIATAALLEGEISKVFSFEIKDGPGPEKFWGRWGMITHEKWGTPEVKSRYRALQFLNLMRGNKVNVAGEGSWVKAFAKEDGGVIRLLVVNYDPQGKHFETVPMSFINLPFKNFSFRRKDFSGETKEQKVSIDGTSWQTSEGINANSAAIFTITPI